MKRITYNPAVALSILYAALLVRNNAELNVFTTDKEGTDMGPKVKELYPRLDSYAVRVLEHDPESAAANTLALGIESTLSDVSDFHTAEELSSIFNNNSKAIDDAFSRGRVIQSYLGSKSYQKFLAGKEVQTDDEGSTNDQTGDGTNAPDPTAPATGVEQPTTEEELKGGTATTEDELKNPVDGIETPIAVPATEETPAEEAE